MQNSVDNYEASPALNSVTDFQAVRGYLETRARSARRPMPWLMDSLVSIGEHVFCISRASLNHYNNVGMDHLVMH